MNTRDILKIALGVVGGLILIVGGLLIYELFFWQGTTVVEKTIKTGEGVKQVEQNKWKGRGEKAIAIVRSKKVQGLPDDLSGEFDTDQPTLDAVLSSQKFRSDVLNYPETEPAGWQSEWWGETKYGDHYYRVRFGLKRGAVTVGPSWVVDLKRESAKPKNLNAKVAQNPEKGKESEYYGKAQQVVSAITSHTFESGVTLGGTLLQYFTQRTDRNKGDDTILGWTIQHDRESMFDAYFQWKEGDHTTYAEFQFDYEQKALKAVNLHAGEIMEVGETFAKDSAVNILPQVYNAEGESPSERWTGSAGEQFQDPDFRDRYAALDMILSRTDLIDGIEWLLTSEVKEKNAFEECKKQKDCVWNPEHLDGDTFKVTYSYNLDGQSKKQIAWKVNLDSGKIEPEDRVSELAYRVLHPRG